MALGPPPPRARSTGLARRLVHREEIIAVDLDRRQPETGGTRPAMSWLPTA